jgi:hypothetical protein
VAVKPNVFAGKTVTAGNKLHCSFNAPLQPLRVVVNHLRCPRLAAEQFALIDALDFVVMGAPLFQAPAVSFAYLAFAQAASTSESKSKSSLPK